METTLVAEAQEPVDSMEPRRLDVNLRPRPEVQEVLRPSGLVSGMSCAGGSWSLSSSGTLLWLPRRRMRFLMLLFRRGTMLLFRRGAMLVLLEGVIIAGCIDRESAQVRAVLARD